MLYQLFFAMSVLCVVCAVATPPGEIPSWLKSDGRSDLHSYSNLLQALERKKKDGSPRFCRKTSAYKPDRAHYCAEAGGCVLQYQHFSLTFNTAVGFYNYKYYLLAAFYGALTSGWALVASGPDAADILSGGLRSARAAAHFQNESLLATCSASPPATARSSLSGLRARGGRRGAPSRRRRRAALSRPSPSTLPPHLTLAPPPNALAGGRRLDPPHVRAQRPLLRRVLVLGGHIWLICIGRTAYEARQVRAGLRKNGESLFHYGAVNNFGRRHPLLSRDHRHDLSAARRAFACAWKRAHMRRRAPRSEEADAPRSSADFFAPSRPGALPRREPAATGQTARRHDACHAPNGQEHEPTHRA